jgi:putative glycosyltransferase
MKLSIVSTLYRSAPYIQEFYERVSRVAASQVGDSFELILVNDGSPDNSLDLAVQIAQRDSRVVVVDLSRNFGHHKAMMAGLGEARGERVFLLDSDLEEAPESLVSFMVQMDRDCCDVVYGIQETRKGGWFERWSGAVFYTIFNWLSNIDHPRNLVTMRLMTKRFVDSLLLFREHEMVISCIWVIAGFDQRPQVIRKAQKKGTTYTLAKKFNHAVNAITSFSAAPLKMIFYTGLIIFFSSLTYSIWLIQQRMFAQQQVDGWTSVMVSIWLLAGLIILFIGVIGAYLSKIFMETKRRPPAIIRHIYGRQ